VAGWADAGPRPAVRRRRTFNRPLLEQVADVYRAAKEAGLPPTVTVADKVGMSHRTATRWIREARDRDVLGKDE
jgi:hypothetical protein